MHKRAAYQTIRTRLHKERHFIQVVMGPRQVGKSTVVKQVLKELEIPFLFFSADNVPATDTAWVSDCWAAARSKMKADGLEEIIIIIDEIQKIRRWSEAVKKEWDDDSFHDRNIKLLILGSSRVMLEQGVSDSLAGRFEEIRMGHWTYPEMRDCFRWTMEQYIFYGAYPGATALIDAEEFLSMDITKIILTRIVLIGKNVHLCLFN